MKQSVQTTICNLPHDIAYRTKIASTQSGYVLFLALNAGLTAIVAFVCKAAGTPFQYVSEWQPAVAYRQIYHLSFSYMFQEKNPYNKYLFLPGKEKPGSPSLTGI